MKSKKRLTDVRHGRDSTYNNYACRCDLCKTVHSRVHQRYRIKRRGLLDAFERDLRIRSKFSSPRRPDEPTYDDLVRHFSKRLAMIRAHV